MQRGDLVRETSGVVATWQRAPYQAIVVAVRGEMVDIVWTDTMEPDTSHILHLEVVSEGG